MKNPLIHLCIWGMMIFSFAYAEVDPFAEFGEESRESEAVARVVTEKGRRTLEILRTEKIDSVKMVTGSFEEGVKIVRDRLAKHGIEVRMMKGRKRGKDGPLSLVCRLFRS